MTRTSYQMTMKHCSTASYMIPACQRQEEDDDDDDDDGDGGDDDDKSVMLEDLDTYRDDYFQETDIPKCCDASKPSMTDSESCELIIGEAYPVKKEPVDEDSSVVYNDVDVGSDDDDDDDDKSVMLEDLEQSHAIHYNRAIEKYQEFKEQQTKNENEMSFAMPTRRDCFIKDEPCSNGSQLDTEDSKPTTLKDIQKRRVIPRFVEIAPPGYSDDDDDGDDGDDDCDNNDDNSVEPYIPSVISDIHCEEYRSKGSQKDHKAKKRKNQRQTFLALPKRRTRRRTPQLWVFLLNSLLDPELNPSIIEWKDKTKGVFKLKNTKKIAQIWGQRMRKDHKKPMDYEKFSRAIRYYYHKHVIISVPGRLTYQFGPKAIGWKRAVQSGTQ